MKFEQCKRCSRYVWDDKCDCKRFECAIPWRDEVEECSWHEVYAREPEYAAEIYAERSDSEGDYTIAKNCEGDVWVRDEDGVITKWGIEAEQVVNYSACEKRS